MKKTDWEVTTNRYVAFFDIMGFKDLVARKNHGQILEKLQSLTRLRTTIHNPNEKTKEALEKLEISVDQTRSVAFSDSIIFFSKGDSDKDLQKILVDSSLLIDFAIADGVGIKGALSYGEITVDFTNSIYFGQPLIDAYLLHEELLLYSAVLDNNIQERINESKVYEENLRDYSAPFKSGRIRHLLMRPGGDSEKIISQLEKFYHTVSGRPRIYVDNTIDFVKNSILIESDE